jgi:hypothetical protein
MKDYNDLSTEELKQFYTWRISNRWFTRRRGKWEQTSEHPTAMSDKTFEKYHRKSTEELLNLFYQENENIQRAFNQI